MATELTEEEMRRALFGGLEATSPATANERKLGTNAAIAELPKLAKKEDSVNGLYSQNKGYAAGGE